MVAIRRMKTSETSGGIKTYKLEKRDPPNAPPQRHSEPRPFTQHAAVAVVRAAGEVPLVLTPKLPTLRCTTARVTSKSNRQVLDLEGCESIDGSKKEG